MKMIQITQVGFVFFPFFFGASPSRGSANAWPSRLTCSNSLVLLSNVFPQKLHCVLERRRISRTSIKRRDVQKRVKQPGDTGEVRYESPPQEGSARGNLEMNEIEFGSKKLTAQPLFASLSRAFFAASRALRFSRFDNDDSPFVEPAVPATPSSRTISPPFLAWWWDDSPGVSVASRFSSSENTNTRSPPVC